MARRSSAVTSIARVAEMLGEEEDWLRDISDGLEPEDGRIWVMYDDEQILAFTEEGIENLKQTIIEEREYQAMLAEQKAKEQAEG